MTGDATTGWKLQQDAAQFWQQCPVSFAEQSTEGLLFARPAWLDVSRNCSQRHECSMLHSACRPGTQP